jgi:SAM-dependent methyltransferase
VTERPRRDSLRRSYDAVAEEYAVRFNDELDDKPLDRALLAALVEQTEAGVPIADVGCGPGHVAAFLAGHGARAVGIDLSPAMVETARRLHPDIEYRVGDFCDLPATEGEFAGVVAFYSIIHLEPSELVDAFREISRVLRPGGLVLLTFHVGTQVRHRDEWLGHAVDIDFRFLETSAVIEALESAGFVVQMQLERVPYPDETPTRRAYVSALKEAGGSQ